MPAKPTAIDRFLSVSKSLVCGLHLANESEGRPDLAHDIEKFLARPGDVLSLVVEEDILRLEILKGLSRASIATLSREYELSRPL
jgi:hypothetical protein